MRSERPGGLCEGFGRKSCKLDVCNENAPSRDQLSLASRVELRSSNLARPHEVLSEHAHARRGRRVQRLADGAYPLWYQDLPVQSFAMDFTPLYLHSAPSSSLVSPNGAFVLSALEDRLVIRSSKTLEVIRSWKCGDKAIKANKSSARVLADSSNRASVAPPNPAPSERAVDSYLSCLSFSPLSSHVAALVRRPHPVAYVFALDAEEPVARLAVGAEGVAAGDRAVRWTPAGDALMIWSDWNVRRLG